MRLTQQTKPYFHGRYSIAKKCWLCNLCSDYFNWLKYLKQHLYEVHEVKQPRIDLLEAGRDHEKFIKESSKSFQRKMEARLAQPIASEKEKHQAEDLLNYPNWLEMLLGPQMEEHICRDTVARRLLFKIMASAFALKKPMHAYVKGRYSSGKSFLAYQVSRYFPIECIEYLEGMTPKAMYYEVTDEEEDGKRILDLSGKIWVFTDITDVEMIRMLRAMMSHDAYERDYKTTIDQETVTIKLRGFACVVFCTASKEYDEEFSTRSMTITPEMSQEKFKGALMQFAEEEAHPELEIDPTPYQIAIRRLIETSTQVRFSKAPKCMEDVISKIVKKRRLRPRDMRDWKSIFRLARVTAWLNQRHRQANSNMIDVKEEDWETAVKDFEPIIEATTSGLDEEQLTFIRDFPAGQITQKDCIQHYYNTFHEYRSRTTIREGFLDPLEMAGYIQKEKDPNDKRAWLYWRTDLPKDDDESEELDTQQTTLVEKVSPQKPTYLKNGEKRKFQKSSLLNAGKAESPYFPASEKCGFSGEELGKSLSFEQHSQETRVKLVLQAIDAIKNENGCYEFPDLVNYCVEHYGATHNDVNTIHGHLREKGIVVKIGEMRYRKL